MTLGYAIKYLRESANDDYLESMLCDASPSDGTIDERIRIAREKEQMYKWLKELSEYKSLEKQNRLLKIKSKMEGNKMGKIEYNEISRAAISDSRNAVISNCSKGGFTIAQQLVAQEDGKTISVFMKGAFHVDDVHGLYELRDAINYAIMSAEGLLNDENTVPEEDWDEE